MITGDTISKNASGINANNSVTFFNIVISFYEKHTKKLHKKRPPNLIVVRYAQPSQSYGAALTMIGLGQ
jgi:hypothetical protein